VLGITTRQRKLRATTELARCHRKTFLCFSKDNNGAIPQAVEAVMPTTKARGTGPTTCLRSCLDSQAVMGYRLFSSSLGDVAAALDDIVRSDDWNWPGGKAVRVSPDRVVHRQRGAQEGGRCGRGGSSCRELSCKSQCTAPTSLCFPPSSSQRCVRRSQPD